MLSELRLHFIEKVFPCERGDPVLDIQTRDGELRHVMNAEAIGKGWHLFRIEPSPSLKALSVVL